MEIKNLRAFIKVGWLEFYSTFAQNMAISRHRDHILQSSNYQSMAYEYDSVIQLVLKYI